MHDDLKEVIQTAKDTRDRLIRKELAVKEANAIASQNHGILQAHAIDLRERMFLAETQHQIERHQAASGMIEQGCAGEAHAMQ